jgi:hypothetical protein
MKCNDVDDVDRALSKAKGRPRTTLARLIHLRGASNPRLPLGGQIQMAFGA